MWCSVALGLVLPLYFLPWMGHDFLFLWSAYDLLWKTGHWKKQTSLPVFEYPLSVPVHRLAGCSLNLGISLRWKLKVFWSLSCMLSCPVLSNSLRPHGLGPTRLLWPGDYPGKNTGVDFLLQRFFPTQDQIHISCGFYVGRQNLYHWATQEAKSFLRMQITLGAALCLSWNFIFLELPGSFSKSSRDISFPAFPFKLFH